MRRRESTNEAEREAERLEIHREMERLVGRLRELDVASQRDRGRASQGDSQGARGNSRRPLTDADMRRGLRVRCARKDQYRGRTGTILGPHSESSNGDFWDILLDKLPHETMRPTIYKKAKSLTLADEP